jgi:hypothetical protein
VAAIYQEKFLQILVTQPHSPPAARGWDEACILEIFTVSAPGITALVPGCGCLLDLDDHANIVCDGQIWCLACQKYPPELADNCGFAELKTWSSNICLAFKQEPVLLLENPEARFNWHLYWHEDKCLLAEAYHDQRAILLYPPGQRLITLCHELAHIFTRQDHTPVWAVTFASLVAWVKENHR